MKEVAAVGAFLEAVVSGHFQAVRLSFWSYCNGFICASSGCISLVSRTPPP